jgi:hypothetical protein
MGETIKVKFLCDNSKVSKPVQEFKLKLHRKYVATGYEKNSEMKKRETTQEKYVTVVRVPGCSPHAVVERILELQIPEFEQPEKEHTPRTYCNNFNNDVFGEFKPSV